MKNATITDLRYHFPKIERLLLRGEDIEVTKRGEVIALLVPVQRPRTSPSDRPNFQARMRKIFGKKKLKPSGAELLAQDRERF